MRFFRKAICLLAFLPGIATLSAQSVPPALEAVLNHTLDSMRALTGAKSLSAAIQFSDGAVWAHADGISSETPFAAVTPDDAYLTGSVTKTITSACILQLADEGALQLDDSLYEWLDTIPYVNPNITIRQLMQHTSGLFDALLHPNHNDSMMADISRVWTPEELVRYFMDEPLFEPGTSWSYCNTNYFLLSMIIKKATGNPFYTELRNRFFDPLSLGSFAIPAYETLAAPVAHVWIDLNGDLVQDDAHDFYMSFMALNSSAGAAGGYFSTPSDCSRWMRTYMRGDLLSPELLSQARTTVFAPGSQGGLYGLGMMKNSTDFLGYEAYGHGGDLAYHASSWYFTARDASITVFTNDNNVTSWALIPVVRELLRSYTGYEATALPEAPGGNSNYISAYPNPFNSQFKVTVPVSSGSTGAVLTDVLGRTVATPASASAGVIYFNGLEQLPKGTYFLQVAQGGKKLPAIKVVK